MTRSCREPLPVRSVALEPRRAARWNLRGGEADPAHGELRGGEADPAHGELRGGKADPTHEESDTPEPSSPSYSSPNEPPASR